MLQSNFYKWDFGHIKNKCGSENSTGAGSKKSYVSNLALLLLSCELVSLPSVSIRSSIRTAGQSLYLPDCSWMDLNTDVHCRSLKADERHLDNCSCNHPSPERDLISVIKGHLFAAFQKNNASSGMSSVGVLVHFQSRWTVLFLAGDRARWTLSCMSCRRLRENSVSTMAVCELNQRLPRC